MGAINLSTATVTGTLPVPNMPAAGSDLGAVKKAAALAAAAPGALTINTGGTPGAVLGLITGAVYATDAAGIKDALASLATNVNAANARLEDLIAKLQAAGALS